MGYRRKSRQYALQMLYQYDVSHQSAGLADGFWADTEAPENIMEFSNYLVDGVIKNLDKIDDKIRVSASNWSIERMAVVDRNILRMSVFELFYITDIPVKVTINEAIEIAKRFGEEESGSFVNGILDRIVKDHQEMLDNKFKKWLAIEVLACEALAQKGEIPESAVQVIKDKGRINTERINEIELDVKHDVIAFLTAVSECIGDEDKYLHLGLTSSDVLDTGLALQLMDASDIILHDLNRLLDILRDKAHVYKNTVMIGRSHGIHAEPVTFGLKMSLWYEETKRNIDRLVRAREAIAYGKISGAVGTFANIPPFVEEYVCSKLGLKPEPISTQIIQRDRHAEFMCTLGIISGTLDKIATEIRHLQRTEVLEVEEPFTKGQKGSSAMPHKRNPVGSENICGLARIVRSNCIAALENISLWHERDISHSSVERIIMPDSTILIDYMLNRLIAIIKDMVVYPENMMRNLNLTHV